MSEIKTEIKANGDGSYTITEAHTTADVLRWLLTQDTKETILSILNEEALAAREPLTDEQNRELFAAFVKKNLGDIAVMDGGRYISPKINNYWLVWQEARCITKGNT